VLALCDAGLRARLGCFFCSCRYHLRRARSPLAFPFLFSPFFCLPGRPVATAVLATAAVLTLACARTRLCAHPRACAPTHMHVFASQGKLDPFACLSVPSRARRRSALREPRRHRRGSFPSGVVSVKPTWCTRTSARPLARSFASLGHPRTRRRPSPVLCAPHRVCCRRRAGDPRPKAAPFSSANEAFDPSSPRCGTCCPSAVDPHRRRGPC
jgi:hypothetical protein